MALTAELIQPKILTYEAYMAEGEINRRYDIIDGERVYMASPTDGHQDIVLNVAEQLRAYQRQTRTGKAIIAPCDVLITRQPLRTRQPDVLFISWERYGGRTSRSAEPLAPAPEIAVEVLSPSETPSIREGKITDHCSVGVAECWVVNMDALTVELLRLAADGPHREAIYGMGQTLPSLAFPDLTLALDDIFRIEE